MGGGLLGQFRSTTARVPVSRELGVRRVPAKPALATAVAVDPHRREHRRAIRRVPDREEPLARVRLRAGRELDVVNICDAGALVDGIARLHPGAHVDVHVTTREGRVLVRSRVVRAFVTHLEADSVRYAGALAFESPVDTSPS